MLPEECAAVASWDPELPACVNLRGGGLEMLGRRAGRPGQPGLGRPDGPGPGAGAGREPRRRRRRAPGRGPAAGPDRPARPGRRGHRRRLARRLGRTTAAPIGVGADGPFVVDLRADGPHAPDRGHHRRGQVRAAADDHRLAGRGQPAGRDDLRAHRLQGRQRVQGLRPPAAHRRHGHRPGRPPDRAGAGLAVGRAASGARRSCCTPGPRTSRTTGTPGAGAASWSRCPGWC